MRGIREDAPFDSSMPIPEPAVYRPSNLTKTQRKEQLAAVYGVPMAPELTAEEIERMRQIVARHDSEHRPIQTFDLNNPPRQSYRFQKFPMMIYDHENSYPAHDEERTVIRGSLPVQEIFHVPAKLVSKIVHNQRELDQALEDGWSEQAPEFREEEREEPLSARYQAEADRIQSELERVNPKRGRGRPPRARVDEGAVA